MAANNLRAPTFVGDTITDSDTSIEYISWDGVSWAEVETDRTPTGRGSSGESTVSSQENNPTNYPTAEELSTSLTQFGGAVHGIWVLGGRFVSTGTVTIGDETFDRVTKAIPSPRDATSDWNLHMVIVNRATSSASQPNGNYYFVTLPTTATELTSNYIGRREFA